LLWRTRPCPFWEERERRRLEILAVVEQAEASLARGEGRRITTHEEVTQLAQHIKRRGMARLSAEQILGRSVSYVFRPWRASTSASGCWRGIHLWTTA
jgi:hypothetical protein